MDPGSTEQASEPTDRSVPGVAEPTSEAPVRFRLYISPPTPTSARACANLEAIVGSLGERGRALTIETIDVAANPLRAIKDRIIVTPTLMHCGRSDAPPPIVGDFSDTDLVRAYLEAALGNAETG